MSNTKFVKKDKKDDIFNYAVIGAIAIIVCSLLVIVSNNKGANEKYIKEISYSEYKEMKNEDDYRVFLLAAPNCGFCQQFKPIINQVAKENNFIVYYVNVHSEKLSNEEYLELRNSIEATKNETDEEGNPSIPTPTTVIYKSGVEIGSRLGRLEYDVLKSFLHDKGVI